MKAYPGLQLICFHTFTPVIGNELYQSLGDPQGVPAIKGVGKHVLHDVMCLLLLHQREVTCCRGQTGDVTFFFYVSLNCFDFWCYCIGLWCYFFITASSIIKSFLIWNVLFNVQYMFIYVLTIEESPKYPIPKTFMWFPMVSFEGL